MPDDSTDATEVKSFSFPDGFSDGYYLIAVTADKFNAEAFFHALAGAGYSRDSRVALFAAASEASSHFALLTWFEGEGEFEFRIDYEPHTADDVRDDVRRSVTAVPSAEGLMQWLGTFFKYDTAQSHLHAKFRYKLSEHRSRYPLPVHTSFGDSKEAYEIYGISVSIPSRPRGVTAVRLTHGKAYWSVEVIADKRISFRTFSPDGDMRSIRQVVDNFLETKQ